MINPETHWQSCINTTHLREPLDSYEILKLKMKYPAITHKEIAEKTGYELSRINYLSTKYYHASRVQAFSEYQMQQLAPLIINQTSEDLKLQYEENQMQNIIDLNDVKLLGNLQKQYSDELTAGIPHKELRDEYDRVYQRVDNHRESRSRTNYNNARIVEIITNKEKNKPENRNVVNTFISSIQSLRDEKE